MPSAYNELNGHKFEVADTTPNAVMRLKDADQLREEYEEDSDSHYLFDEEFRGKYLKAVADVVMDFVDEDFNPDEEFFQDGDLEVSTIQDARSAFLGRVDMIGM